MTGEIEWRVEPGLLDYTVAVAAMEARVAAILDGTASELIWLVEHPALYTAGTSATGSDVVDGRFPVFASGRGGRHTYHGPGQRVVYVMLDLSRRKRDVRRFITALEHWIIAALAHFGIQGSVDADRVGVWIRAGSDEAKIAAIGVRIRRWVTFHGVAINVAPDLDHYAGIVPCGLPDALVTSLAALGCSVSLPEFDSALQAELSPFIADLTVTGMCDGA